MNTPYGLEIIENCVSCKLRRDKWFCGLSPDVLKSFSAASHLNTYPGGAILFVEGQTPRGVLVLCSGKVKLWLREVFGGPNGRSRTSGRPPSLVLPLQILD